MEFGNNNGNNDEEAVLIKSYTDIDVPVFFENAILYHGNMEYFLTVTYTDSQTQKTFHEMLESLEFAEDDFSRMDKECICKMV